MRPVKGRGATKHAQYDFCTIQRVNSGGVRYEDLGTQEPMAWPEYLEYFTQKAPSYQRGFAEHSLHFIKYLLASCVPAV